MGGSVWRLRATGTPGGMVADAAELRRALALFPDPEFGCELVALKSGEFRNVPGNDLEGLVRAAHDLPGGSGLYFRLNPVPAGLTRCAKNEDVIRRRWVYIDVDPVKAEAHKDDPATDAEKAVTAEVADSVCEYLSGLGWPAPVVVDSGNGHNLLYRCDLPNDEPTRAAYRRLLKDLGGRFGGRAKIDAAVHNPNRLAKLPGTWARKGTPTADRPYRVCRLVAEPDAPGLVTAGLLEAAAGPEPERPAATAPHVNGNGAAAYGKAALEGVLEEVVTAVPGERNATLYRAAARLGELAAGGVIDRTEAERLLEQAGTITDPERPDVGKTVERGMKKGAKEPKGVPERPADPTATFGKGKPDAPPAPAHPDYWSVVIDGQVEAEAPREEFVRPKPGGGPAATGRQFVMHTFAGLMQAHFPEPVWVVPGTLSEGLNILAGKPKMGKSMLALNLAMTVAAGGKAMGNIQTSQGDVLYLSLEDRTRRLQSRGRKMLTGIGCAASSRLTLAAAWPRQGEGGLELIEWWMKRVERPTLVIIDVWGKFRPPGNPKANAYSQDYEHMTPLKNMTDEHACCALALMHCRKGASDDIVEDVSGTLGIAGAADGIIVLSRSRNDNEAKIFITGRDVADTELALRFDDKTLTWTNLGKASDRATGEMQRKVVAYLKNEGAPRFAKDIAIHIHSPGDPSKSEVESVRIVASRLAEKKIIRRVGNAYAYPGDGGETDPEHWTDL